MFLIDDSIFILSDTKIMDLNCASIIQGCFILAQSNSTITGSNIVINYITSLTEDNIFLSTSLASFNNLFMFDVSTTQSKGSCFGTTESKLEINQAKFEKYRGNCLNIKNSYISLSNNTFRDNVKTEDIYRKFGAFYCLNCLQYLISNSTFENNQNIENGAALFFINELKNKSLETLSLLGTIIQCNFAENSALENGGAIYFQNQLVLIENSFFFKNEGNIGGAIFCHFTGCIKTLVFVLSETKLL